ncbi:MAG: hypothetical protein PHE53_10730 [Thermoguttaceae bacterium]|nr:hypothetical protein [Thermoguttaceae bacterium]
MKHCHVLIRRIRLWYHQPWTWKRILCWIVTIFFIVFAANQWIRSNQLRDIRYRGGNWIRYPCSTRLQEFLMGVGFESLMPINSICTSKMEPYPGHNGLTPDQLLAISQFPGRFFLGLNSTNADCLPEVSMFPNINTLNLEYDGLITDFDLFWLKNMNQPDVDIILRGTNVTEEGLAHLQAMLPNSRITYHSKESREEHISGENVGQSSTSVKSSSP